MREISLAKRYASGLIKAVDDKKEFQEITGELSDFMVYLSHDETFSDGMGSFLFSKYEKKELLDAIQKKIKMNPKTVNFLKVVAEENRMGMLNEMIVQLDGLWLEREGFEKVIVFSSNKLKDFQVKELNSQLEKMFQKKVIIENRVDKSLIAGIKIQRGSVSYDFSINGNLIKLKQAILEEK